MEVEISGTVRYLPFTLCKILCFYAPLPCHEPIVTILYLSNYRYIHIHIVEVTDIADTATMVVSFSK